LKLSSLNPRILYCCTVALIGLVETISYPFGKKDHLNTAKKEKKMIMMLNASMARNLFIFE
jgi:hypothetical protein